MTVTALERLRRYDDPRAGYSEELLGDPVGDDGLGILTRPLGPARRTGFVLCRAPGPEESFLHRLEAMVARDLAANGFPSIRIRRGFGHEGEPGVLCLSDGVVEAEDAVGVLASSCDLERVGALGGLLGAAVALRVAGRRELPLAGLWCPVANGSLYLRDLRRRHLVTGFMTPDERVARREPLEEQLARGPAILRGLRLTPAAFEELSELELGADAGGGPARVLLVAVTKSGDPDGTVRGLAESLERTGRVATVQAVQDPLVVPFGDHFVRKTGNGRRDLRLDADRELTRITTAWALAAEAA